MATISTMAMLNLKCLSMNSPNHVIPSKPTIKPISLLSLQNLPKGLTPSKSLDNVNSSSLFGSASAGVIFTVVVIQHLQCDAEGDNRGPALLSFYP
ncbi:hypothetical protein AAC387_Pa12g1062 [Persea americana]